MKLRTILLGCLSLLTMLGGISQPLSAAKKEHKKHHSSSTSSHQTASCKDDKFRKKVKKLLEELKRKETDDYLRDTITLELLKKLAAESAANFTSIQEFQDWLANYDQGVREALAFPDVPNAIGWTQGVGYEILQQAFWDQNNPKSDFGNINGITSKLDYLSDLGIESIWVMQPTYGHSFFGFDTVDAKRIDPASGTNQDFVTLINAAHDRNMKIMMGSVWHQTSTFHPFFQRALQGDQSYMDRYFFEIDPQQGIAIVGNLWKSVKDDFPSSPLAQRPENWYYRSVFGTTTNQSPTADTNLTNPVMIDWVVDFSKFWIDKGIDGFRIDFAPGSQITTVDTNGNFIGGIEPNDKINQTIIRKLRQIKPDLYITAEEFFAGLNDDGTINPVESGLMFGGGRTFGGASDYQLASLFYDLQGGIDINYPFSAFRPNAINNGELFINQYVSNILPNVAKYADMTFLEDQDLKRFITLITIPLSDQPVVTLTPPASYSPAPTGAFRIHYDVTSLPPALANNNLSLYYFTYSGSGASNPFASGAVNNLAPAPGNASFPFLGGGDDAYGPYWDFPIAYLTQPAFSGNVFGFIGIQTSGLVKVTNNINITDTIANAFVAAGKGDVFVSGVPVPTTLPTQDQLNQVQTFYGLLLALPGSPMIFQGQEQGMQGANSDSSRESVIWSTQGPQVTGFDPYNIPTGVAPSGYENIFSTAATVRPPDSTNPLWVYMREAIRARRDSVALKQGSLQLLPLPGDPTTDVVTIFDQTQNTVTTQDVVAFTRSINGYPVYCIFNFGETPKEVNVNVGNFLSCNVEFFSNAANVPAQIYYTHNTTIAPVANPGCSAYTITMPQFSSVVFTPVEFLGTPSGGSYQNLPACCVP